MSFVESMFDHPIIDVALGLVLFYVLLSLFASAIQEWIASLFALRSRNLRSGIQNLISEDYAKKVYAHPLINNLAKSKKLPSYIAPKTLSAVLLEIISKENSEKSYVALNANETRAMVDKISSKHPLKEILSALIDDSEDASNALKNRLAEWFDEGMSRVSGWYKRMAKVYIFVIAALIVLATNANSIQIAEELWQNEALRTQIAAQAQSVSQVSDLSTIEPDELNNLKSFPIGWSELPDSGLDWITSLLGWFITITAVSLGAPFWFDLLGKVANLRGAGGIAQTQKSP